MHQQQATECRSSCSSIHRAQPTLNTGPSSSAIPAAGTSLSLPAHCISDKSPCVSGGSSPRTPTSPRRPRWDCSPRVLSSNTHISSTNRSASGSSMEQMQTPQQGSAPKRMNSQGSRSKKQHAGNALSSKSEPVTGQHDLSAAVSRINGGAQQEGESFGGSSQAQQQQQQQQQQQPYELRKQDDAVSTPADTPAVSDSSFGEASFSQAESAAPAAMHTADEATLLGTGTDTGTGDAAAATAAAAAAGGQPGSSIPVPPLPQALLPAVNGCSELSQGQLDVLGAWYCLYCPQPEAQQAVALARRYDEKASFEDNFVKVFGREQIGVMFYVMRRATSRISMAIEKIEVLPGNGSGTLRDTYQLRIVGRHSFYFPPAIRGPLTSLVLPPALEAWATDVLTVRASDDVVLSHVQRVHNIPTMPWLLRSCLGVSSSMVMMHLLGW